MTRGDQEGSWLSCLLRGGDWNAKCPGQDFCVENADRACVQPLAHSAHRTVYPWGLLSRKCHWASGSGLPFHLHLCPSLVACLLPSS